MLASNIELVQHILVETSFILQHRIQVRFFVLKSETL
jgi:hypothetical protein